MRRLTEGSLFAEKLFLEKVWWPLFHQFNFLHPEYEVQDYKDGYRYLDFAYLRPMIKLCFEIDGYGPHMRQLSRWQFIDQLERQNHLVLDGWTVIRFSYDQVKDHPRRCQQITEQIIARLTGHGLGSLELSIAEKEIVSYALQTGKPFSPREICQLLDLSPKPVRRILSGLVEQRMIEPAFTGRERIHGYRLVRETRNPFL
ncbi:DUF559 domain-containing protein [Ammoniphilus oxalaticus]|uniref:DUF559 domain-containing protein n=1 Tax=Ammoniphilus oxalaticus TaxID=66863 RepID=UPI001FEC89B6|nr:DUF559 domain-containing protein [Ammoniphilus oxalaticus]